MKIYIYKYIYYILLFNIFNIYIFIYSFLYLIQIKKLFKLYLRY